MSAFIVSEKDSCSTRIREVLTFCGLECPSSHILTLDDTMRRLGREADIDLIVLVLQPHVEDALNLLTALARFAPGKILAVGPTSDSKLVLRTLRCGAFDYVDAADLEAELEAAIARLSDAITAPAEPGKLVALLSPNGGSGSSTIAANLAVSLAKEHQTVGLLDMKLEVGDLAALLDLRPTYTLSDLCQNVTRMDQVMFERSLVKHASGVHLLAPPQHLVDVAQVRPEGVAMATAMARSHFPYVVADLDHTFREEQMVILRQADIILLVFRLDFTSLRNVHRNLEYLDKLEIPAEKIRLVVNRYGQSQEVPAAKAEEALGRKIAHFIPEDAKAINRANNHGVPVVIEAASAKVSKSIMQLATSVNGRHRK
ncbi:AAA family ATPase [Singulisphaera sp. PoT]|uniref:AAA family ATPase n=1 Tax=Singulisphaera sp. PoT TaxID=3411797 RepID=UPI003BF607A9